MRTPLPLLLFVACAPCAQAAGKIMIFGGESHDVYLGCLNCSEYASDSVHNRFGNHGSKYSQESVHNSYGPYGSRYSSTSACSPYATDPPVVVDDEGGFYGCLTLNRAHPKRVRASDVLAWLAGVCAD